LNLDFWWNNGVSPNQYGKPGRSARKWGEDTLEGDLDEDTLLKSRRDQTVDTAVHKFRDEEYYRTRDFDVEAIEVPLLSIANWVSLTILERLKYHSHKAIRGASCFIFEEMSSVGFVRALSTNSFTSLLEDTTCPFITRSRLRYNYLSSTLF
jgi:hypothetical protein